MSVEVNRWRERFIGLLVGVTLGAGTVSVFAIPAIVEDPPEPQPAPAVFMYRADGWTRIKVGGVPIGDPRGVDVCEFVVTGANER